MVVISVVGSQYGSGKPGAVAMIFAAKLTCFYAVDARESERSLVLIQ